MINRDQNPDGKYDIRSRRRTHTSGSDLWLSSNSETESKKLTNINDKYKKKVTYEIGTKSINITVY